MSEVSLMGEKMRKGIINLKYKFRSMANMEEYPYFILYIIFYQFLSNNMLIKANEYLKENNATYYEAWKFEEVRSKLRTTLIKEVGYVIEPKYLLSTIIEEVYHQDDLNLFISYLIEAVDNFQESALSIELDKALKEIFEDFKSILMNLRNIKGNQSEQIMELLTFIRKVDLWSTEDGLKVLEEVYSLLLNEFANEDENKDKFDITPPDVSRLIGDIVREDREFIKEIYDPTCGFFSLPLNINREIKVEKFYGQEINFRKYNLAIINMMINGVGYSNWNIKKGDVISNPGHMKEKFDVVLGDIPISLKWNRDKKYEKDERFVDYGFIPPRSTADYIFIMHMLHHLSDNGVMVGISSHGILFRGGMEGSIREKLIIDKNYLDAVIGLPANLFYNSVIPRCILVFKKNRKKEESILFIDASKEYGRGDRRNILRDHDIEKIVESYINKSEIEGYSHNATLKEIKENNYNLNIPRYVDTFESEAKINISDAKDKLKEINKELEEIEDEIKELLEELLII